MGQPETEGGKRDPLLGILWDLRVAESFAFYLNGRKLFAHLIFEWPETTCRGRGNSRVIFSLFLIFSGALFLQHTFQNETA